MVLFTLSSITYMKAETVFVSLDTHQVNEFLCGDVVLLSRQVIIYAGYLIIVSVVVEGPCEYKFF